MTSSLDFLLSGIILLAGIFTLMEVGNEAMERCCSELHYVGEEGMNSKPFAEGGRGLTYIASNPVALWRVAAVTSARFIEEVTGKQQLIAGDYLIGASLWDKFTLAINFISKCGLTRGVEVFTLYRRILSSYPSNLRDAEKVCEEAVRLARLVRDGC